MFNILAVWNWLIANKKLVAILLAFLLVIGYVSYNYLTISSLQSSLEDTRSELVAANAKVDTLAIGYKDLVIKTDKMQVDLNRYTFILQKSETNYENALKLLNSLKGREKEAYTNPTKLAADVRKEVEDFEKEYECITGKVSSCSQ